MQISAGHLNKIKIIINISLKLKLNINAWFNRHIDKKLTKLIQNKLHIFNYYAYGF